MKRILLAAVLALLAAPSAFAQDGTIATLAAFDGVLDVVRTGISLTLYSEMPLVNGDVIHTRDGWATIRFEDRTELRLKAHTRLAISDRKERRDVDVFFGRLWAFIAGQKEKTTQFKTGGTIAAIRGTTIEYAADEQGTVDLGVLEGDADLLHGGTSTRVSAGFRLRVGPGGPGQLAPFQQGDITENRAPGAGAAEPPPPPPPPPAPAPEPEPVPPAAPEAAPVPAPGEPPAADIPLEPAPEAAEEGEPERRQTQGEYAIRLLNALGITSALPPNATARDAIDFLTRLRLFPCGGKWIDDKPLELEDLACLAGLSEDEIPSQEQMIEIILRENAELFWLQARRKQTVSPFAP